MEFHNHFHPKIQTLSTSVHFQHHLDAQCHSIHKQSNKSRENKMSHLSIPPTPTTTKPITRITKESTHLPFQRFYKVRASGRGFENQAAQGSHLQRRSIALGLGGVVVGLNIGGENAKAARRPPPPPVQEKKDPSVGGLMAKVLASKKRKEVMNESMTKQREKEVMNESMTKQREKGKAIQEQSQQPDSSAD